MVWDSSPVQSQRSVLWGHDAAYSRHPDRDTAHDIFAPPLANSSDADPIGLQTVSWSGGYSVVLEDSLRATIRLPTAKRSRRTSGMAGGVYTERVYSCWCEWETNSKLTHRWGKFSLENLSFIVWWANVIVWIIGVGDCCSYYHDDCLFCNNYRGSWWSWLCSPDAPHPARSQCYHSCRIKGLHGLPLETEVRGHGGCGQWAEHEVIHRDYINWTQSMTMLLEGNLCGQKNWYHRYEITAIFFRDGCGLWRRTGSTAPSCCVLERGITRSKSGM